MRSPSFRTRILLLILAVGLVPLGLLGLWITRTVPRSGERLVQTRLDEAMAATVNHVTTRWVSRRSEILFLAEAAAAHTDALQGVIAAESEPPSDVLATFSNMDREVGAATVRDADGRLVWSFDRRDLADPAVSSIGASAGTAAPLSLDVEIYERQSGERLGTLVVEMGLGAILAPAELGPATAGMVVAALDSETGVSLLPLALDPSLLRSDAFLWAGDRWLALRRSLNEPPLTLVLASPLSPIMAPLEETARRSTWLLVIVAVSALLLAAFITGRMTRSLASLSDAAAAVSKGDLQRRVAETGTDEVGKLARAFNRMTESLKKMLAELSSRESLAAVGEFAASLAHEVRNPLTAIRIDLQMVEEGLADDSELRVPQQRALREVTRLDETVSRALSVARSGRIRARPMDLREPIQAASEAATPSFESRGAKLDTMVTNAAVSVSGDPAALEQLFLNLLRNSAESLGAADSARVSLLEEGDSAVVILQDDGSGIPSDVLERVFEPFFSTRPEGTGLGLPIARRIAAAHGGELELASTPGAGTTATVRLPLLSADQADSM